jgi:hypothetical protein
VSGPLEALIGRQLHYWGMLAMPQFVRHDAQPFTARICFVHPDGSVLVRFADHYGAVHVDTHVPIHDRSEDDRHGKDGATSGYCTWPEVKR